MTELDQLCRAVAVEVLGLKYRDSDVWGRQYYDPGTNIGQLCPGLTWDDAGRVVEAMLAQGYLCTTMHMPEWSPGAIELGGAHYVVFMREHQNPDAAPDMTSGSYPEYVYRAALQAVRGESDNG